MVDVTCATGKIGYPTRGEARRVLRGWRQRGVVRASGTLEAYLCYLCRKWHLGNRLPRVRRRKALAIRG